MHNWFIEVISQGYKIYAGAGFIAVAAAIARVGYTSDKGTCTTVPKACLFFKFLAMGLPLTMLTVHVGRMRDWTTDDVIMVSSAAAFMSRELLEFVLKTRSLILQCILRRFDGK